MFEGFGLIEEGTDWKEWQQREQNMHVGLFEKTAPGSFPSWNMFQLFMVLRGGKYSVINKWELISWRDSVWVGRSLCCFWMAESLFLELGRNLGWFQLTVVFLWASTLQAAQGRAEIQNYMCQPTTNHLCGQGGLENIGFFHWAPEGLAKKPHFSDKTWRITSVRRHATLKPPTQTSWLKHGNISNCTVIIELSSAVAGTLNTSVMTMGTSAPRTQRKQGLVGEGREILKRCRVKKYISAFFGTICRGFGGFFYFLAQFAKKT